MLNLVRIEFVSHFDKVREFADVGLIFKIFCMKITTDMIAERKSD
jgi:hypothetical protein